MTGCCEPRGYDLVFSSRRAEHDAARFQKSGLTWAPRRTVELFREGIIGGRTVLEIGGGVGDLQLELLRAGVDSVVSVEISTAYERAAARLLEEAGFADRSLRLIGDFARKPDLAQPADMVILHSVVCCYPDAELLLARAVAHARRYLVMSYPRDTWWLRAWAPLQNLYPRIRGSDWRFYVHPVATIMDAVEREGLRRVHAERDWVDHLAVLSRVG